MDGRDIGTVILPDADVKIFLCASNAERARRRCDELHEKGIEANYEQVLADDPTHEEARATLAARKQVVYLNPGEVIADETGILPADATTDGIHLNGTYIRRWADYLYSHTVADVDPALFYEIEEITE